MAKVLPQNAKPSKAQPRSYSEISRVRRRQFSSCDQCRKGKRACDIITPSEVALSDSDPCSNCSKTGKVCTTEWLRSRDQIPQTKRKASVAQIPAPDPAPENQIWDQPGWNEHNGIVEPLADVWDLPLSPASYIYQQNSKLGKCSIAGSNDGTIFSGDAQPYFGQDLGQYGFDNSTCFLTDSSYSISDHSANSLTNEPNGAEVDLQSVFDDEIEQRSQKRIGCHGRSKRRCSMPASSVHAARQIVTATPRRMSPFPLPGSLRAGTDPSSANLEYRLAASSHKSFISENLLKIYHDSMENALSCWLTEKTCPYDIEVQPYAPDARTRKNSMDTEWGPLWSNRICERVCNLDRAAGSLRGRLLTPSEDRAVDKALKKTIMSFATQWAHSSSTLFHSLLIPTYDS